VDILKQSSRRVSSSAELYGAVQQEARIARAVEVILAHVENLKRVYEREKSELEEVKRVLSEHNISMEGGNSNGQERGGEVKMRSLSVTSSNPSSPTSLLAHQSSLSGSDTVSAQTGITNQRRCIAKQGFPTLANRANMYSIMLIRTNIVAQALPTLSNNSIGQREPWPFRRPPPPPAGPTCRGGRFPSAERFN